MGKTVLNYSVLDKQKAEMTLFNTQNAFRAFSGMLYTANAKSEA